MATIDLIVLGILKKESLSAYDIQNFKVGENQHPIHLQKSNPAGRKGIY